MASRWVALLVFLPCTRVHKSLKRVRDGAVMGRVDGENMAGVAAVGVIKNERAQWSEKIRRGGESGREGGRYEGRVGGTWW